MHLKFSQQPLSNHSSVSHFLRQMCVHMCVYGHHRCPRWSVPRSPSLIAPAWLLLLSQTAEWVCQPGTLKPLPPSFSEQCACVCVEGRSPAERRSHCLGIRKGECFQQLYLSNSSSVALLGSPFHKMRTRSPTPTPLACFPFLYLFLFKSLPLPLSAASGNI